MKNTRFFIHPLLIHDFKWRSMKEYEKAGSFYLGRELDPLTRKPIKDFLYPSKYLTTHAFCVGMTGSGKTGLGIGLLEEAGIDKIPAIVIDPKGDFGNLYFTFPELEAEQFKPWIDKSENAAEIAKNWKEGLAAWDLDGQRIKRLRESVDFALYTPASHAGIPIALLTSFNAPSPEELADPAAMREKILTLTDSLLG